MFIIVNNNSTFISLFNVYQGLTICDTPRKDACNTITIPSQGIIVNTIQYNSNNGKFIIMFSLY